MSEVCFSSLVGLFCSHNEDWFPLCNDMSCLHFLAGTLDSLEKNNQTGPGCFYFKSRRNRSKPVLSLHTPLAMRTMFQSKRKPAEEMLSRAILVFSCYSCLSAVSVSSRNPFTCLLLSADDPSSASVRPLIPLCIKTINW